MFKAAIIALSLLAACPDCKLQAACPDCKILAFCPDCKIPLAACPDCKTPAKAPVEQTLAIIKPDALDSHSEIEAYYTNANLKIIASKTLQLTQEQAEDFYSVHKDKPFFSDLVSYMSSGPVEVLLLQGEDAVAVNRQVIGSTNPLSASPGTIRADFGTDIQHNAVHGSDSLDNAKKEIAFFFSNDLAKSN